MIYSNGDLSICVHDVYRVTTCRPGWGHIVAAARLQIVKTVSQLLAGGFLVSWQTGGWAVPRPLPTLPGELTLQWDVTVALR